MIRRTLIWDRDKPLEPRDITELVRNYGKQEAEILAKAGDAENQYQVVTEFRETSRLASAAAAAAAPPRPVVLLKLPKARPQADGAMFGRVAGDDLDTMDMLSRAAEAVDLDQQALLKTGGVEPIGGAGYRVQSRVGERIAAHRQQFTKEAGQDSALKHAHAVVSGQSAVARASMAGRKARAGRTSGGRPSGAEIVSRWSWEITHLAGHGQMGKMSDHVPENLVAAGKHANTEMMFYDNRITGNPDIEVETWATVYADTRMAKQIHMVFYSRKRGEIFFERTIEAMRPSISPAEAQWHRDRAREQIDMELDRALHPLTVLADAAGGAQRPTKYGGVSITHNDTLSTQAGAGARPPGAEDDDDPMEG